MQNILNILFKGRKKKKEQFIIDDALSGQKIQYFRCNCSALDFVLSNVIISFNLFSEVYYNLFF